MNGIKELLEFLFTNKVVKFIIIFIFLMIALLCGTIAIKAICGEPIKIFGIEMNQNNKLVVSNNPQNNIKETPKPITDTPKKNKSFKHTNTTHLPHIIPDKSKADTLKGDQYNLQGASINGSAVGRNNTVNNYESRGSFVFPNKDVKHQLQMNFLHLIESNRGHPMANIYVNDNSLNKVVKELDTLLDEYNVLNRWRKHLISFETKELPITIVCKLEDRKYALSFLDAMMAYLYYSNSSKIDFKTDENQKKGEIDIYLSGITTFNANGRVKID